jgi:transposase InsO family protein
MTASEIAECLSMPLSTVSAVLLREGLGKRSRLAPLEPANRYERRRPGELVHIDIKKLARIVVPGHAITGNRRQRAPRTRVGHADGRSLGTAGWEFVHVAIDDHSRLALASVVHDEKGDTATTFLEAAIADFTRRGVRIERVMTDNGSPYRAHAFRDACAKHKIRHLFTKPYTPRTNGKAERFIQTLLREWAYARPYTHSWKRTRALRTWLRYYNHHRPHGSLDGLSPFSRLRDRYE